MIWNAIKSSLLSSLPESEFGLWIKPLECREQNEQSIELVGPDRYFCAWVEDRYIDLMKGAADKMGMTPEIKVRAAEAPVVRRTNNSKEQLRLPGVAVNQSRYRSLHPAFTFDQFMVGESNVLAQSACSALATGDRTYGNCLFMNSSTGLGKSHLTQAVVHEVLNSAPATRMQYLTAQQFTADMVKNLRSNSMEQFSKKYIDSCDLLLVEDVHTLVGKNKTQEELNTVLDYLIKSGRRVILTSAVAPSKLKGLDEDFRSRMTSGLVTDIVCPDYDTRTRIIRHKLQGSKLKLDEELVDYLARSLKGDIRRMESTILGVKAKASLRRQPPNMDMLKEIMSGFVCAVEEMSATGIRDLVSEQFKVSTDDLRSRSRKRAITYPRQIAMYLTRKFTKDSLADIGGMYNRDHSTVLYAVKVITRDMARQNATKEQIDMLCSKLEH